MVNSNCRQAGQGDRSRTWATQTSPPWFWAPTPVLKDLFFKIKTPKGVAVFLITKTDYEDAWGYRVYAEPHRYWRHSTRWNLDIQEARLASVMITLISSTRQLLEWSETIVSRGSLYRLHHRPLNLRYPFTIDSWSYVWTYKGILTYSRNHYLVSSHHRHA